MATKPHHEVPRPCVPPVWFFPVLHMAPERDQLFLNPLQYSLSLKNSGTKRLRERCVSSVPRDHTEECVSNLGTELLSPEKPLWISAQWFLSNLFRLHSSCWRGLGFLLAGIYAVISTAAVNPAPL